MEQGEAMTTIPEIGKRKGKKKTKRDKVVTKQNTSGH